MGQLEEMKVFVEIAKAESITGAANRMEMAPSAVSRRLKELENRLGVQLLTRTTRQVSLTEVGRSYLASAIRILEEVQEAENEIVDHHDHLSGTMRISAPISWGMTGLPDLIADFLHEHENLKIEIDLSDRRVDLVEEAIEIAIRIGDLPDSSLIARRLASIRSNIFVHPEFIKQHGPINKPEDLEALPGLLYQGSTRADIWSWQRENGTTEKIESGRVSIPMKMKSNNGDMLAAAASKGLGVTLLPDFIAAPYTEDDSLVPVLTEYNWGNLALFAVYPPTRHLATRTRKLIDYLVTHLAER